MITKYNDFTNEKFVNKKDLNRRMEIDITGPDGNAFSLIGYAKSLSKELDLDFDTIQKEMTSSDYENLLDVFDKYFGEYVDIIR